MATLSPSTPAPIPQPFPFRTAQGKELLDEHEFHKLLKKEATSAYPARASDFVAPEAAIGGWIFLGQENGGDVVEGIMPDTQLDCVVIPPAPIKIKTGDLIGHLGRYDSLNQQTENRMVHLEVFSGDDIQTFIQQGRDWVDNHGHHPEDWKAIGLPSEPTILRIGQNTKLYKAPFNEGQDPPLTDVIQIATLANLGKNPDNKRDEIEAGSDGKKRTWWHVHSADMLGRDIDGWVRQENFKGGRVTLEHAQSWIDFDTFEDTHDSTHTMFATTKAYVDHSMDADVPAPAALDKLSPLMAKVYRAIYPKGDGSHAADELSAIKDDPWHTLRASRLIIKHESEWANPGKWKQLTNEIEQQTGPKPQHAEEQERIEKLVWWDEVKAGVPGFPAPAVFHIHPGALVGNFFINTCSCKGRELSATSLKRIATHATDAKIQEYIDALNQAFSDYSFDTCIGRAHFIAQILAESGEFKYTRELGNTLAYDPWRGRGLIQVTYEANYRDYQTYSGEDVTSNAASMSKLERAPHALLSAAWFYTKQASLMAASDADDFIWIVRKINGGFNGYDHRLSYFNSAVDALGLQSCLKLNKNGSYIFEDSKAYNDKRASFAWGMWHDTGGIVKSGIANKSSAEAIRGYRRYIELDDAAGRPLDSHGNPKDQSWYGIGSHHPVRIYAESRLHALGG